jgi:CYTH domain-containing protein
VSTAPREIERRFLVRPDLLPRSLPKGERLRQGYLSFLPLVRVRNSRSARGKERAWLTVKGRGMLARAEFEYRIPPAHAHALFRLCGAFQVFKTRRLLGRWVLDEYRGRLKGLWLAEIELRRTSEKPPPLPLWLGREVTYDLRYTNSYLARLSRRPSWLGR